MADAGSGQKPKVFISYSRRDSTECAEELVEGLKLAGFEPLLDRRDIVAGEDWEARLGGLIKRADTVVFVISPEAGEVGALCLGSGQGACRSKACNSGHLQAGFGS